LSNLETQLVNERATLLDALIIFQILIFIQIDSSSSLILNLQLTNYSAVNSFVTPVVRERWPKYKCNNPCKVFHKNQNLDNIYFNNNLDTIIKFNYHVLVFLYKWVCTLGSLMDSSAHLKSEWVKIYIEL